jgi:hypothetical protein
MTWTCAECGISCREDYYMLEHTVWDKIAKRNELLHLKCVEKRLGRKLRKSDFMDIPFNKEVVNELPA